MKERNFRRLFGNSKTMRLYFKDNKINEVADVLKMLKFYEEAEKGR